MTVAAMIHGGFAFQSTIGQNPQEYLFHWLSVADLDLAHVDRTDKNRGFRHIHLTTKQKGLIVQTREGYYAS